MSHDYPSMPAKFKDRILANRSLSYTASASVTGNSLRFLSGDISAALKRTQGSFPVHLSDAAGNFVYLTRTAGQQYDDIRAYLESRDKVYIADWVAEIEESLKTLAHWPQEHQKAVLEHLALAALLVTDAVGSTVFSVQLVISGTAGPPRCAQRSS